MKVLRHKSKPAKNRHWAADLATLSFFQELKKRGLSPRISGIEEVSGEEFVGEYAVFAAYFDYLKKPWVETGFFSFEIFWHDRSSCQNLVYVDQEVGVDQNVYAD